MSGPDRSSPRQRPASFTTSSGERAPCTPTCVCARPDTPPRWLLVARGPLNTPWTWWWPGGSSARACGAGAGRVRTTSSLFGHSPWTPRPGGPGGVMLPGELRTPASPSRLRVPGVDGRGEENYASRLFMTGKGETLLRFGCAPIRPTGVLDQPRGERRQPPDRLVPLLDVCAGGMGLEPWRLTMGGFAVAEDAMTERRGQAILTTDIDLSFVPKPVDRVSERQLGDELVLYDPEREAVFVLDPIGSVIWRCLDGEVSLGELSEDIVEVLKAPSEEVPRDVVELARRLGAAGLLVGVPGPPGRNRVAGAFEVGEELPPFSFPDMTGRNIDLTKLAGGRVLLVNWNTSCGFCRGIAPELAALAPALAQRDVELVLLS